MTTDINKGRIGAFVCGAILFLVMSIILLGRDSLFSDDIEFIMFFNGSVSGLSVGAPVVFRGVPLGRVTNISLFASSTTGKVTIPVTVKINESNILQEGYGTPTQEDDESYSDILHRMIKNGLRARLEMASLLTGQSRIELDFFPDSSVKYIGEVGEKSIPEIPTIDSTKDKFIRTISDMPLDEIAANLLSSLEGISNIVNNEKFIETINSFSGTLLASKNLFEQLNTVSLGIEKLVYKLNSSVGVVDNELPTLFDNFNKTMLNFSATFDQMQNALVNVESVVSPNSTTIRNINNAIVEFKKASRSVKALANTIERNPESLLRGKGEKR